MMKKITEDTPVTTESVESEKNFMCSTCRCADVCVLKSQYHALQTAIDDLTVNVGGIVKLKDISWIGPTVLTCKHYIGPQRWR